MGVLITDEPEETLLDIRLDYAERDASNLIELLQRAYREASKTNEGDKAALLSILLAETRHVRCGLAELISTRGK